MPDKPLQTNAWFLRKSTGETYGPVDLDALREWAGDGRIAPDDSISTDGEDWRPAFELDPLDMVWLLKLADGQSFGPAHRGAFEDMLKNGALDPPLHLRHRITGAETTLGAERAAETTDHRGDTQPISGEPVAPSDSGDSEGAPEPAVSTDAIALDRDRFAREAAHWQSLYEKESEALRETAARLSEAIQQAEVRRGAALAELEPLRAELAAARAGIDAARIEADALRTELAKAGSETESARAETQAVRTERDAANAMAEAVRTELDEAKASAEAVRTELAGVHSELVESRTQLETCRVELDALRAAPPVEPADSETKEDVAQVCRDLMLNYDRLVAQFADKTVELRQAREEADAVRSESEARLKAADDHAARERHSAEAARRRLEELESSYAEIVKSYRDINDRFIQMRERQTSGRPAVQPGSKEEPQSSANASSPAAPARPESKSRIRLRR